MITLTTDFGWSEYVGTMKGAIYSICPEAGVVDITHDIRRFDVRHGAYVLYSSADYFPEGTIHCAVVDPGVGTGRQGVIIRDDKYTYVGPDNGLFHFVEVKEAYHIDIQARSKTFHGRDIFAPIAARLDCGATPEEFGPEVEDVVRLDLGDVVVSKGEVRGTAICVDSFGNIITNIKREHLKKSGLMPDVQVSLEIGGKGYLTDFKETYGETEKNQMLCLLGSSNHLEISVNQGDAGRTLGIKGGEEVMISR